MRRGFALLVFLLFYQGIAADEAKLVTLQRLFNSARRSDPLIHLEQGSDFEAKVGTVIFLSRQKGIEKMIALARANRPEIQMLYLPGWNAWITETTVRQDDMAVMDATYAETAIFAGIKIELWHIHNDLGIKYRSDEERRKVSLQGAVPSGQDFVQLYSFATNFPGNEFYGFMVNIYGVTKYWHRNSPGVYSENVRYSLINEGYDLNYKAGELPSIDKLSDLAKNHKGLMRLQFQSVK